MAYAIEAIFLLNSRLREVVDGNRGVSADTALRLERHFGSEAQGWLNLQTAYDLRVADKLDAKTIDKEIAPLDMAQVSVGLALGQVAMEGFGQIQPEPNHCQPLLKAGHRSLQSQSDAHGGAALVLHIVGTPVVREWCGSALAQLGVTHKQVDLPTRFLMIDDASALTGFRCGAEFDGFDTRIGPPTANSHPTPPTSARCAIQTHWNHAGQQPHPNLCQRPPKKTIATKVTS